ncbi:MAG: hypothetical protein EXS08_11105 [Planctomycetes bacterium]|nr:hypothetical protein [Planctomycetota bacterium]
MAQIGTPLLAYLAHPNKGWTFTAADLVALRGTRFIEIVNGSAQANSFGDEAHPSVEALWDQANLERARSGAPLLFGIAGEDEFAMVFNEYDFWDYEPHPGNPWIAVRAQTLNSDELLLALQDGDFYGSTGLELEDVRFDGKALTVDTVDPSGLREFRTRFIGARRSRPEEGGVILLETREDPAVYTLTGDELFVRAQVISDFIPYDSDANVHACAWTQPVQPSLAAPEPR